MKYFLGLLAALLLCCAPAHAQNVNLNCATGSAGTQWNPAAPSNPCPVIAGGNSSSLNITGSTVVKASPGKVVRVVVNAATATATITINDATTTGAAAASNTILTIPVGTTVGTVYYLDWPCVNGIVVAYGASATGTLAVSYQ